MLTKKEALENSLKHWLKVKELLESGEYELEDSENPCEAFAEVKRAANDESLLQDCWACEYNGKYSHEDCQTTCIIPWRNQYGERDYCYSEGSPYEQQDVDGIIACIREGLIRRNHNE